MDSMVSIFKERAENEMLAAKSLKKLSESQKHKVKFNLPSATTFYSSVVSHSYYAIFYSAKALLLSKNIKTSFPEVHKKTYDEFKRVFVDSGLLDVKLLKIYEKMIVRADYLLQIFKDEKWKRGHFTYKTIPQANKEPAEDSIKNAGIFLSNVFKVLEKEAD